MQTSKVQALDAELAQVADGLKPTLDDENEKNLPSLRTLDAQLAHLEVEVRDTLVPTQRFPSQFPPKPILETINHADIIEEKEEKVVSEMAQHALPQPPLLPHIHRPNAKETIPLPDVEIVDNCNN